jgi:hypothetical protein
VLNAIASAARRSTVPVMVGVVKALALHTSWLVFPKEGYMSIRYAYSLIGALSVATLVSNADVAFADRHKGTPATLVGCIMKESDYRELQGPGRGGWLNTGAGVGNEYILVNAVPGPINEQTAAEANCENMSGGRAYELKGPAERKRNLEAFVGHRIEVSGRIENAKTDLAVGTSGELVAGEPTGGPVNPRRRDLRLFEMRMDSFREIPIAQPVALFVEPEAAPVAPEPAPPAPAPEPQYQAPPAPYVAPPVVLPKTASPMELMGLLGLLSMGGAFGLRTWRLR